MQVTCRGLYPTIVRAMDPKLRPAPLGSSRCFRGGGGMERGGLGTKEIPIAEARDLTVSRAL